MDDEEAEEGSTDGEMDDEEKAKAKKEVKEAKVKEFYPPGMSELLWSGESRAGTPRLLNIGWCHVTSL